MYTCLKYAILLYCTILGFGAQARNLNIVVTIKPYYNLLLAVTHDLQQPQLLISGNNSPHDYLLTPDDVLHLQRANVIIWGGREVEKYFIDREHGDPSLGAKDLVSFFQKKSSEADSLEEFNKTADFINVSGLRGLNLLKYRHDPKHIDPHLWLSPHNAKIIVLHFMRVLQNLDPSNAATYAKNTQNFLEKLQITNKALHKKKLHLHSNYLVFHDAYQYFEYYYGLAPPHVLHVHPELPIKAKRIQAVEKLFQDHKICCVFTEPQFSGKMLDNWREKYHILSGELDPLGRDQDLGVEGYLKLIKNIMYTLAEVTQNCSDHYESIH